MYLPVEYSRRNYFVRKSTITSFVLPSVLLLQVAISTADVRKKYLEKSARTVVNRHLRSLARITRLPTPGNTRNSQRQVLKLIARQPLDQALTTMLAAATAVTAAPGEDIPLLLTTNIDESRGVPA